MFLTLEKLEARTRQLEAYRYIAMQDLTPMEAEAGKLGRDEVYTATVPAMISGGTLGLGDEFVGRDRYLWARRTLRLPNSRPGCTVTGLFDFGKTGGGHTSGFESLLFVNGTPYQGVDTNHNDVNFEELAGQEVELTFLLWTGLEGGGPQRELRHRIRQAEIGYLVENVDELYYLSKAIYKTLKLLPDTAPEKYTLTEALDGAYRLLNWDADKLHGTVAPALEFLQAALARSPKSSAITVSAVGHTHIDVAWLWRLKHTREKAIRSFSTVLKLMDEFPEYLFLQSQPQLYDYVKNDCPALYEKIKARVADGRWEAGGGMWVEADCNISSGEALVRQFTHGINFFREELGTECEYLWLPDVFGYSWALPQILALCNINTFMTTKISWNQFNSIPNDLFRWRGIDGTEVLTYFITTPEVGHPMDDRFSTYNGQLSPRTVLGSWQKFKNKALSRETLICYGYGDGGGGVNRNMLKMRRAMDQLPGLPNVKTTTARDFFRRLHQSVDHTDQYLPTWDGELYLEYHRGTYTSQAHSKLMNRRLEYGIAECEWLCCLGELAGSVYPAKALYQAWETVLLHQFHDIIPGSSIREVYEDSDLAYGETATQIAALAQETLGVLIAPADHQYTLYQSGTTAQRGPVLLPVTQDVEFRDDQGNPLQAQRCAQGWLVDVTVPGLAMTCITATPAAPVEAPSAFAADLDAGTIETPFYSMAWDREGHLIRLTDKHLGRELLTGPANLLEIYEDKPLQYDNWDLDIFYTQKRELCTLSAPPRLVECGSERAVLHFDFAYNQSVIAQEMMLYRTSRRIDFVTHVDWHEADRVLKAAFPVDIRTTKATYDIQFGHVERPTHFNTSWDWARFEVVGHKWADLSEPDCGVSLLNDCKYGYNILDNVMKLTLLKSSKYPDTQADMGEHDFTYALLPHGAGLNETIAEGIRLNLPVRVFPGRPKAGTRQLVQLSTDAVNVDALKKADHEDCLVLRLHECHGTHTPLQIQSDYPLKAWAPCNLLEENLAEPVSADRIDSAIKPFEIKVFKLWFR